MPVQAVLQSGHPDTSVHGKFAETLIIGSKQQTFTRPQVLPRRIVPRISGGGDAMGMHQLDCKRILMRHVQE